MDLISNFKDYQIQQFYHYLALIFLNLESIIKLEFGQLFTFWELLDKTASNSDISYLVTIAVLGNLQDCIIFVLCTVMASISNFLEFDFLPSWTIFKNVHQICSKKSNNIFFGIPKMLKVNFIKKIVLKLNYLSVVFTTGSDQLWRFPKQMWHFDFDIFFNF